MTTLIRDLPGRRRLPAGEWLLVGAAALIAAGLLAPLVIVVADAQSAGWGEIGRVLFRARSWMLLQNTVILCAVVAVAAATIGTSAAWLTERAALRARRMWTVLLVLPVALPDFVVGYAWHSLAPRIQPLLGASIVMTLGTYPLVYLPVAAALRRCDPAAEDVARSLGAGGLRVFARVTLPRVRTAVLGGVVLVCLTTMSEYGAFEILRYQTFTTEIFNEFQFDAAAAGALSIPLVALGVLVLACERLVPRRVVATHAPRRPARPSALGWKQAPAQLALAALAAVSIALPVSTVVYWMTAGQRTTLPASATVVAALRSTVVYSAWGGLLAVSLAVPVALLAVHRRGPLGIALERSTYVTRAVPGVVVALSLVFFATRYAFGLYETSTLLVIAYAILNFPLALVCVHASAVQMPRDIAAVGRSLGRGRLAVFVRLTLPLLAPGIVAGFFLVFLTATTELTATLVLAPIGVQTLATQFWAFEENASYGAAAPYALVMVALAVVPGILVGLWFDRERHAHRSQ